MTQNSTDFNNLIRDVSSIFDTLIADRPSFLGLLGSSATTLDGLGNPLVTNTKYEWTNESLEQFKTTIASFDTDGDGTGINLVSANGIEVGSILRFEKATGASITELVKVTAISTNDLTVTRAYGSTTGVTLVEGDVVILNSTPREEDSAVGSAILQQGTNAFNYTEIFDEVANLSATAMALGSYDNATKMAIQSRAALVRLARKIENAAIHGVAVQRSTSENGSMAGVLAQIKASGGNVTAVGGAISESAINDLIETIIGNGGMLTQPLLLCSPRQGRKISALNTTGSNPTIYKANDDRTLGNFTTTFIGDLTLNGLSIAAPVFIAQNMVQDQLAVLDMSKIATRVMRGLVSKDATTNGTDGQKERLITELTLEVQNATKAHGLLTGLTL